MRQGAFLPRPFGRINAQRKIKGYLVNLSYVNGYAKTEVTLTSGEELLLSKYKYQDFVKAYLCFLKEGAGLPFHGMPAGTGNPGADSRGGAVLPPYPPAQA